MKCLVDGAPVERTHFIQGGLGSRQVPSASLRELTIIFDRAEFVQLLANEYRLLVRELKVDIERVGGADDDELAYLQHVELSDLMDHAPNALPSLMQDYLWTDLCRICFGENQEDECEYVVNKFRGLGLIAGELTISSSAYPMPRVAR